MFSEVGDILQFCYSGEMENTKNKIETRYSFWVNIKEIRGSQTITITAETDTTHISRNFDRFNVVRAKGEREKVYILEDDLEDDYLNRPYSTLVEVEY